MGEQGAAMQKVNQELVKSIEQMKVKREELLESIDKDEQEKEILENAIKDLELKLHNYESELRKKKELLEFCNKSIKETESGFMKILESSQVLLAKVLKESEQLLIKENLDKSNI